MTKKSYEILKCSRKGDISRCASIVRRGGILVFPTDTVYGIGCEPHNEKSVEKIFKIKGRDETRPLPVLASDIDQVEKIAFLGKTGRLLARRYWPGALTIVAPLQDRKISAKVTAGRNSIAVRVPGNKCIISLLEHCNYIVGTSANLTGNISLKSAAEVLQSPLDGFDVLLDGEIEGGVESTIVDITGPQPEIIREGAIGFREIGRLLKSGF